MTDDLTKTFFDTFGIKVSRCTKDGNCYFQECSKCDWYIHTYPQITDRILLELIAIHSTWRFPRLCCLNIEELKEQVLSDLIIFNDKRFDLI